MPSAIRDALAGLIGFMTDFLTATKGYGILNHTYLDYRPMEPMDVGQRKLGVLVAMEEGMSTAYSLGALEERGTMFIEPRTMVYEGMIVGEANRETTWRSMSSKKSTRPTPGLRSRILPSF
jgi:GTP-binding protein